MNVIISRNVILVIYGDIFQFSMANHLFSESVQLEHTRPRMLLGYPDTAPAHITNVNYPLRSPSNLVLLNVVTCPAAHNIRVALPLEEGDLKQHCGGTFLEIDDPYKLPRKSWRFCKFSNAGEPLEALTFVQSYLNILKLRQVTGEGGDDGLLFKLRLQCV